MKNRSKSGLFLIELIIALLFFAVGAVVCVQMFLHAHNTTEYSKRLSSAVAGAQTAAEIYEVGGVDLLFEMTDATQIGGEYHASFDAGGRYMMGGEYRAVFTQTQQGDLSLLNIEIFGDDELLFDMETAKYEG